MLHRQCNWPSVLDSETKHGEEEAGRMEWGFLTSLPLIFMWDGSDDLCMEKRGLFGTTCLKFFIAKIRSLWSITGVFSFTSEK